MRFKRLAAEFLVIAVALLATTTEALAGSPEPTQVEPRMTGALWEDDNVLATEEEILNSPRKYLGDVITEDRVVFVDGVARGLDLTSLDPGEAAALIARWKPASSSLQVAVDVLCSPDVISALASAGHDALSLSFVGAKDTAMLTCGEQLTARKLYIKRSDATTRELAAIMALGPRVRGLNLQGEVLSEADLQKLAILTELESLSLWFDKIGDLSALQTLPKLWNLAVITFSSLDRADLAAIASNKSLTRLELWIAISSGTNLDDLAQLRELRDFSLYLRANIILIQEISGDDLRHLPLSAKHLGFLAALPRLTSLGLDSGLVEVDDDTLKTVGTIRGLRRLRLYSDAMTDRGLKSLSALEGLENLTLNSEQFTDRGLAMLMRLPNLLSLDLSYSKAGTRTLRAIAAGAPKLRYLKLNSTRVTNSDLRALSGLSSLRELNIYGTKITDAGFVHLAKLRGLRRLEAGKFLIEGNGLAHLRRLKNLEELTLYSVDFPERWLEPISHLRRLRVLGLNHTFTKESLRYLAPLTKLRKLALNDKKLTDRDLAALASHTHLVELSLLNSQITSEGIKHLSRMTRLQKLELYGSRFGYREAQAIGRLRTLEDLSVEDPSLGDEFLAALPTLPRLRELTMHKCDVSDAGISHLLKHPRLASINLHSPRTTSAALPILTRLPHLETLAISTTPPITLFALRNFARSHPAILLRLIPYLDEWIFETSALPSDGSKEMLAIIQQGRASNHGVDEPEDRIARVLAPGFPKEAPAHMLGAGSGHEHHELLGYCSSPEHIELIKEIAETRGEAPIRSVAVPNDEAHEDRCPAVRLVSSKSFSTEFEPETASIPVGEGFRHLHWAVPIPNEQLDDDDEDEDEDREGGLWLEIRAGAKTLARKELESENHWGFDGTEPSSTTYAFLQFVPSGGHNLVLVRETTWLADTRFTRYLLYGLCADGMRAYAFGGGNAPPEAQLADLQSKLSKVSIKQLCAAHDDLPETQ